MGALYIPDVLIVPTFELPPGVPLTAQTTGSVEFCTVAENCSACPSITFAVLGEMLTLGTGGTMVKLVLLAMDESLKRSAVIVTVGGLGICAGAA
jgi:hypothetical protein